MRRSLVALACALALVAGGCGSPADEPVEQPVERQVAETSDVKAGLPDEGQPDDLEPVDEQVGEADAEKLERVGLRNVEIMGFEIYEPVDAPMIKNEHGVAWTDEHGCTRTVVVMDVVGDEDLSTDVKRAVYGARLIRAIAEEKGYIIGDPIGDGTAYYDFQYVGDDGELRDGEIKVVTDGEHVFGGEINYTEGHEDRLELFGLGSLRPAGEPI